MAEPKVAPEAIVEPPEPTIPGTVLEDEVVTPEAPEPPVAEEPEQAPVAPEAPPEAPAEPPVTPEAPAEEPPPSPREARRIQTLIERLKTQDAPVAPVAPPRAGQFDFKTALDADPEVIQQIEAEVARREQAARDEGISAQQQAASTMFHTRLEVDAPRMESKYPKLDPQATDFDPVAANLLNQSYLAISGYNAKTGTASNASVRYSDFVEGMMELADRLSGEKTAVAAKTIAKQAAQTGIRPGGAAAKGLNLNKAPEDMTDEELEARIATVLPRR